MSVASLACTAVIQYAKGKKSQQLDEILRRAIDPVTIETTTTNDKLTIMRAKEDTSCNMVVQSVAYGFMQTLLLVPAQEMKTIYQKHTAAKEIKVGTLAIPLEERRTNPDTSWGLYVNGSVWELTRAVQNANQKKKSVDEIRRRKSNEEDWRSGCKETKRV